MMKNVTAISGRRRRESTSIATGRTLIRDVTGVILAGGSSTRMGSNKALLPCQGGRFIEAIHRTLRQVFEEVVIITNTPEEYAFIDAPTHRDLFANCGPLAGIHSALVNSPAPYIFAVGCDMPFLNPEVIRVMASRRSEGDVVVADKGKGPEPLHALYSRSCLAAVDTMLRSGNRNIVSFFRHVRVTRMERDEIVPLDPLFHSFSNINTPEEYFTFRCFKKVSQKSTLQHQTRPGFVLRHP